MARTALGKTARRNLPDINPDRLEAEFARRSHLAFMERCWERAEKFLIGKHTRAICAMIDEGIRRYRKGESTFLIVEVPFRHGKSEIISRYLPPHWLGLFPDTEVMLTTYGEELASDLSRDARRIMRSRSYGRTFPGITVSEESSAVDRWGIDRYRGKMNAQGFGGAMTGRGCSLGIVDDYLKRRQDAESKGVRDKVWQAFTDDFMTRRAPVSFIIILATPWHVDDLIGRCHKKMEEDPDFPQFETIVFPASSDGSFSQESLLFPDRFPRSWYLSQRATLGQYGTASLLQCNPTTRSGNLLKTDQIKYYNAGEAPPDLTWVRSWDLASSKKEVISDDPDYTSGMKMSVQQIAGRKGEEPVAHLWIDDLENAQLSSPQRDKLMEATSARDGNGVRVGIESVAGYKDTYDRLRERLWGRVIVEKITVTRDLVARCEDVAPLFEAGNVHIRRASWTDDLIRDIGDFPFASHDDSIAAMMAGWDMFHVAAGGHYFIKRRG